jgi:16S rRNA (adenine(1408)-N(1))-methyltransferase
MRDTWRGYPGPILTAMTISADSLPAALDEFDRIAVDIGCGDGKYALRLAQRDPRRLVIGIDAETTRLDRTLVAARKQRLANLRFLTWSMDAPLSTLASSIDEIHVVMPWGSLLDGVLGGNDAVLAHVLDLGRPGASFTAVVNCRPWDAPASVDTKLASTPVPSQETLHELPGLYEKHGWHLSEPRWLDEREARAIGSSWVSRVISARRAMLLQLAAVRAT